jgi:tungstate transport system substrate-binding protein
MRGKKTLIAFMILALILGLGCAAMAAPVLKMASTTSTANTGLLDFLAPKFQADTGIELQFVAVGTGKALALGKNCDVDVLLVHAPATEKKYVADGFGKDRKEVMYNDFVIIGPKADPAKVKGMSVTDALATIAKAKAVFASRGDNSGTHKKEKSLWASAKMDVPGKAPWYVQTGQGMIKTINVTSEKGGYTMTDRGTFIKYADQHKGNPPLVVLVEGDKVLFNQYSVMLVNPGNCKNVKVDLAQKFSDWITSDKVQKEIGEFKLLGKKLFIPNAKK